ncbi:MAG: glycosyltransferase family 4 protein [Dysosmobacter welbionis]
MRVFIYNGGLRLVGKSGVGQAILHQREMLRRARIDTADHWRQRAGAVHINTVLPDSVLAALAAKLMGRKVIYYGHSTMEDFRRSFRGSDRLAPLFRKWITFCYSLGDVVLTPTEYSRRLLESYGPSRRCTAFPTAWIQSSSRRIPPGGRPSAAAGASGKGSGR